MNTRLPCRHMLPRNTIWSTMFYRAAPSSPGSPQTAPPSLAISPNHFHWTPRVASWVPDMPTSVLKGDNIYMLRHRPLPEVNRFGAQHADAANLPGMRAGRMDHQVASIPGFEAPRANSQHLHFTVAEIQRVQPTTTTVHTQAPPGIWARGQTRAQRGVVRNSGRRERDLPVRWLWI